MGKRVNKRINEKGLVLLKKLEGFSSHAYLDVAGVPTLGFGFTENVEMGDSITPQEAEKRLKLELIPFEQCINEYCHRDLTDNQFASLCIFAYNVGCKAFQGSTLCKMINLHKSPEECSKYFLMWNKATVNGKKVEVKGLTNRRKAEVELFLQG